MKRLVTFQSVHQAIKAERLLQTERIAAKFRPTPRALSVSCGQSMLIDETDWTQAAELFAECAVVWNNLFTVTEKDGETEYARIGGYEDYLVE